MLIWLAIIVIAIIISPFFVLGHRLHYFIDSFYHHREQWGEFYRLILLNTIYLWFDWFHFWCNQIHNSRHTYIVFLLCSSLLLKKLNHSVHNIQWLVKFVWFYWTNMTDLKIFMCYFSTTIQNYHYLLILFSSSLLFLFYNWSCWKYDQGQDSKSKYDNLTDTTFLMATYLYQTCSHFKSCIVLFLNFYFIFQLWNHKIYIQTKVRDGQ